MPALEGEHLCEKHQGNHSHYAQSNCTICKQKKAIGDLNIDLLRAKAQIKALQRSQDAQKYVIDKLREELEETRNAIHQWMQTTDQRGSKDRLIANFVGMYTYKEGK